jgi:carboxypeptidase PM20D1
MQVVVLLFLFSFSAIVTAVFVRSMVAKPERAGHRQAPPVAAVDPEAAAGRLGQMIRKRTVFGRDIESVDLSEFQSFRDLLPELYPEAHKVLEREIIAGHSMLYRWKGSEAGDPLVLMSHYDVVPASDDGWSRPAFSGDIFEGRVWGRGSLDTKCTLASALEAVETLVKQGYTPKHDVYLSFGHNEETGGDGTPAIVKHLTDRGNKPGFVLDEGGAVVRGVFPGVAKPLAMVGVAEKGVTDLELSVTSAGGHSATPPRKGAAWRLARAIVRIEGKPFPAALPAATKAMFARIAPHSPFALRVVLANLWLFERVLASVFGRLGGELNAICRTTTVVTMLEGSKAANVLPAQARAVVNVRIAIGSNVDAMVARLKSVIDDPLVEVRVLLPGEPSPVSDIGGARFEALAATIGDVYPDAVVVPYIVLGGTDARHYANVSRNVYRFSPYEFSKAERASMHAVNESISIDSLAKGIEFYIRLIQRAG